MAGCRSGTRPLHGGPRCTIEVSDEFCTADSSPLACSTLLVLSERVSHRTTYSDSVVYMPRKSDSTVYVLGRRTLIRRDRLPRPDYIYSIKALHKQQKKAVSRPIRAPQPHILGCLLTIRPQAHQKNKTITLHETVLHPHPSPSPSRSHSHASQPLTPPPRTSHSIYAHTGPHSHQ